MKYKKVLLISLLVLVLLLIGLLITAPTFAKNYVNNNGKELSSRSLNLGGVSINYFRGEVTVDQFLIREENEIDTFLFVNQLVIDLDLFAIGQENYRIEELSIDGIVCNISIQDTSFNFQSILHHFTTTTTEDSLIGKEPDSSVLKYSIDRFQAKNGKLSYHDKNIGNFLAIDSLEIGLLAPLKSDESIIQAFTSLQLATGGKIKMEVEVDNKAETYSLNLLINALELGVLSPYLTDFMYIGKMGTQLNTQLNLAGNFIESSNVDIKGNIGLQEMFLNDTNELKVLSLKSFQLKIDSLNPLKDVYQLSLIEMEHLKTRFEYYPETDNFSQLFIEKDSITKTNDGTVEEDYYANVFVLIGRYVKGALEGVKASNFAIDTVQFKNLELDFVDHTLLQPFKYNISQTNLIAQGVRSDVDSLKVQMSTLLNGEGEVKGEAILHPQKPEDISFYLKADDILLKDFTPYFHYFLGLPILKGRYVMESSLSIKDHNLIANNSLQLNDFVLGKRQKHEQAYNLPIKMGVAMLKDRKGNIKLDLPIEGNLSDPKYKVGKVILDLFKELLLKAASSPYKAIAGSMKVGEESSKKISIAHIYDSLSTREYTRLDNLVKLLQEKEDLILLINPYYNEIEQLESLSMIKEKADYLAISLDDHTPANDLEKIYTLDESDSLFVVYKEGQIFNKKATADHLNSLIQLKMKTIHSYLLQKGVEPAQIETIIANDNSFFKESVNKNIQFQILFNLKNEE